MGILITLHIVCIAALNLPAVQRSVASYVAEELGRILQTEVSIGQVDIGLLNHLIIRDVVVKDRQHQPLLQVKKIAAKADLLSLPDNRITIHTAQLFSFRIRLYRQTETEADNFQFILDALSSKDKKKEPSALRLRINSLIIRDGQISYDRKYLPRKQQFDPAHLHITDFQAHISLKAYTADSLNARIRNLSFHEHSGLALQNLTLQVKANRKQCDLTELSVELPHSSIRLDSIHATYLWQEEFSQTLRKLKARGHLSAPGLTLSDLSPLVPKLRHFKDPVTLSAPFSLNGGTLHIGPFNLSTPEGEMELESDARITLPGPDRPSPLIRAQIRNLHVQPAGIPFLFRNLALGTPPPLLLRLGQILFSGQIQTDGSFADIGNGHLSTGAGDFFADGQIRKEGHFQGILRSEAFRLNQLLGNGKWGELSLDVKCEGILNRGVPQGKVEGKIYHIDYNDYRFQDLEVNTYYNGNGMEGKISLNDPNCQLEFDGKAMLRQAIPAYDLTIRLQNFRPSAIGLDPKEAAYSGILLASCTGNSIDDLMGSIDLFDFNMTSEDGHFHLPHLAVRATREEQQRKIRISSNFFRADIEGEYLYSTIPQSFTRVLERYIPSLLSLHKQQYQAHNRFTFDMELTDATPLQMLFRIPLRLQSPIQMAGQFNDPANELNLDVVAGSFDYNGSHYEWGRLQCNNDDDEFKARIGVNKFNKNAVITLGLSAIAKEDRLFADVSWDNNRDTGKFCGKMSTSTRFVKVPDGPMNIRLEMLPSAITVNDTLWNILPAHIETDGKKVYIDRFMLRNGPRHLTLHGTVGDTPQDSLTAELKEINLEYVFDALNFHPVDFAGIATGKAYASNLLHDPQADARLFVRNFHFEGGLLGNMNLYGKWDKEEKGLYLNGYISEFASDSEETDSTAVWRAFRQEADASALTHVEGIVSPPRNGLDLMIRAERTNLHFLEGFVGNIFEDVQGRTSGWCRVSGTFKDIDLTASLKASATAKVTCLNTTYQIESDSIRLNTNRMEFKNLLLTDRKGNTGVLNGNIDHYYLHNLQYNFRLKSDNLLCYDTSDFGDMPFYATAYGKGNVSITGGNGTLRVDADIETQPGTRFVYDASSPDDITDTQFITFRDKTEAEPDTIPAGRHPHLRPAQEEDEPLNIFINMQLAMTPGATLRVIMDRNSGDDVTCNGYGNIQADYFNKGAFRMFGTYNITKGMYKMSMQEIIRKEFALQNGGTVAFNGNPFQAQLDVQAVYTINSVSLRDLSPNASFAQTSSTKVNCLMNLNGNLQKPAMTFDLDLPNVSEEDRDMVKSLVSTEDQMNRQIIYLLGIGRFYGADYTQDNSNQTNQAMNSILTSTLSGQFNQMLSQVINSSNWNFGANVTPGQEGLNDMEFQTMLSGSLFNNRLLINGNFGYRENAMANTNFVGDFDLQWLLTKNGSISLKAYNETNDRYFTKNTLTTQGIGILFKRDFDQWSALFQWLYPKKKEKKAE